MNVQSFPLERRISMLNKSQKIVAAQNMQSLLIQYLNRMIDYKSIESLFSEEMSAYLSFSKERIRSKAEIIRAFKTQQLSYCFRMLNTPAFMFDNHNSKALWDVYAFSFEGNKVRYSIEHFDVSYVEKGDRLFISDMQWDKLVDLVPWGCECISEMNVDPLEFSCCPSDCDPEDFVEIQKIQSRFSHFNRKNAIDLFSDHKPKFSVSFLAEGTKSGKREIAETLDMIGKEEIRRGAFIGIPLISTPYIVNEKDKNHACASWICMYVSFGEMNKDGKRAVALHLGRLKQKYVKENRKTWKIDDFDFEESFSFVPYYYSHNENSRYDRISKPERKWLFGCENMGGTYPEDVFEIESLIPQWTYRLRSGDQVTILDTIMNSREREISRSMRGFSNTRVYGADEFREYLINRQDKSFFTSMPAFHTATTPLVEVNAEGNYAKAVWLDHSISDLYKGKLKEERFLPYAAYIGKYEHEFVKEDGTWKWIGFGWEPLVSLPDYVCDTEQSGEWLDWKHKKIRYPKPFEKYEL